MRDVELLGEQMAYYAARAPEYDDWFYRRGRYDHGPEENAAWLAEVAQLEQALAAFAPLGRVVEFAAGTGLWTRWLAAVSESATAVDASAETLAVNRARVDPGKVEHVHADLFAWTPGLRFDEAVFAFWLSHVPPELFDEYWDVVDRLLDPHGRFFFIDSLHSQSAGDVEEPTEGLHPTQTVRRLSDGRQFRIIKVFYDPDELTERLRDRGWEAEIHTTGRFFLYGSGRRARPQAR